MCALTAERRVPYYSSTMVGREAEFALISRLIQDQSVRLVTVTGAAGVGKTRLTTCVASQMLDVNRDSALFVSLVSISDPALVPAEIGKALNLQNEDLVEAIRNRFGAMQGIVLLDNLEQVVECAPDIAAMLPANPDLTVIVTSQRPLQIEGEHVVHLQPLPVPELDANPSELLQSPSVQLIVDRATDMDTMFPDSLREQSTSAAIAEICRRLDGIPLALELAASRLGSLSPEVVLSQLEQGHQILSSTRRDIPERHRTIHNALSWSFHLLPENSKRIFLWLSTFTAGFDLNIVDHITGHLNISSPAVDTVRELMSLSLVRRVNGGANPWYTMLESMREFCLAELNDSRERAAAQDLVAAYVSELANETESSLTSDNIGPWKSKLDREFATVRSAISWALAHQDPKVSMTVAAGMWRYLEQEGHWLEAVGWVSQSEQWQFHLPEEILIAGLIAKMSMQEDGRDIAGALATASKIEPLLAANNYPEYEVQFQLCAGSLAQDQQMLDDALAHFQIAADLARRHGIERNLAVANANIGIIAYLRGAFAEAEAAFLEVRVSLNHLGDQTGLANINSNLAAAATSQDEPARALEYLEEATIITRELGLRRDQIYTLFNIASAHIALGDLEDASDAAEEAIGIAQDLNFPSLQAVGYVNLAEIFLLRENTESCAAMLLRALALITPEEGSRHMVEIGLLLSDALVLNSRFRDAASVIAKSMSFAEETEFSYEPQHIRRMKQINTRLDAHDADFAAARAKGNSWTTEKFLRTIGLLARKLASPVPAKVDLNLDPDGTSDSQLPEISGLTPREREILQLLVDGNSTQQMADEMCVSPRTVTTHLANIMSKLGVSSRANLVAKVLRS